MATSEDLKVGDWVEWNGSTIMVRIYTGQIIEVREKSYLVVDNEWFATSEVSKTKVRRVEQPK